MHRRLTGDVLPLQVVKKVGDREATSFGINSMRRTVPVHDGAQMHCHSCGVGRAADVNGGHLPRLDQSFGVQCRHLGSIRRGRLRAARSYASITSRVRVMMYWPL